MAPKVALYGAAKAVEGTGKGLEAAGKGIGKGAVAAYEGVGKVKDAAVGATGKPGRIVLRQTDKVLVAASKSKPVAAVIDLPARAYVGMTRAQRVGGQSFAPIKKN